MPNPSQTRRVKGTPRHTIDQLMLVDLLRYGVVALRYVWYAVLLRRMRTYDVQSRETTAVAANTISHNLKGLRDLAVNRSHLLIRPLSVVERLPVDADVLSIGPRSEGELFNLAAHGFLWNRIHALDLISYSPRITLGDMHAAPYADDSFDAVVMGWVLAYSDDRERACREVVRITRGGGVVAVGVEYSPQSQEEIEQSIGYMPGSRHRIASCEEILSYFGDAVDHVYYRHIVAPVDQQQVGAFCLIFSIQKPLRS